MTAPMVEVEEEEEDVLEEKILTDCPGQTGSQGGVLITQVQAMLCPYCADAPGCRGTAQ